MKTVYIVGHNMPGYLPDSDPWIIARKRDAIRSSRADANDAKDAYNDGLSAGDSEYRYHLAGRAGDYWLTAGRGADYHYWVRPVTAELREADNDRYRRPRCANCERRLDPGERAYWIDDADAWVCRECLC